MILNNLLSDDVVMTITRNGLFNLTDVYKYAVKAGIANKNHRPSKFIKYQHEFIDQCTKNGDEIKSVKGHKAATYASLIILLRYIAWIDSSYEYSVYSSAANEYNNHKI